MMATTAALAWVPSTHCSRHRAAATRATSALPRLARGEMLGSRVHRDGSLCYIGAMAKPVTVRGAASRGSRTTTEMCSILACYDPGGALADGREELMRALSARMRSRGPDGSGYYGNERFGLAHERLAIMDPEGGKQPIVYEEAKYSVCANGEIYNFRELQEKYGLTAAQTGSDSEVLLQLYRHMGSDFVKELNGIFGFVCVGNDGADIIAARDHCGIKPLYIGYGKGGAVWFASELKAICDQCDTIEEFPAGHYWTPEAGFVQYYSPDWDADEYRGSQDTSLVREALTQAVKDQMMSDVPIGLLLSGGLDSAVISSIIKPMLEETKQEFITFTVGQEGSPDITAARMMSEFLGTNHHEYLFTSEEACAIIPDVIYHLETYEPELIRSAIPNYFLARLAAQHVKVVLTGEGADELFAGYLYFRDAPDSASIHKELRRIFHHLHNVNCQRADRMTMAHGLEARVPFLDPKVIDAVMQVDPEYKRIDGEAKPEKHALRALFDGEIPEPVLWRTKAMQCEGVGLDWVESLQNFCEAQVTDKDLQAAAATYTINPPQSKEELYYRRIFESHFSGMDKFVHVWEGGCRAGGAAWQNEAYTRFGLKDVTQLAKGIAGVKGGA
uniref:asparagine synthase (glutamine-hydrolyzing) n=1 Tax=Mantoniella antarctica TaxID=81844 RepID=A0A7S0SB12_9CHLO|mmetsp:Transcript_13708/g.33038  ORF Transcript_13708/g.33038 Transcript_13708/m.33038 type:complete len:616 (+) Transcript_13708:233-2080(+)